MSRINGILESALYVEDLGRAKRFYENVLKLRVLMEDDRMCALDAGSQSVLLLFARGGTLEGASVPGGWIPPHDGSGPVHLAFGIAREDLSAWEGELESSGIPIESRVAAPQGGHSLYFRDPDGHLLELATPGLWEIY